MISNPNDGFNSLKNVGAYTNGTLAAFEVIGVLLQLLAVSIGGKNEILTQLQKVIDETKALIANTDVDKDYFVESLERLKSGAETQLRVSIQQNNN